jgi:hypothetical protein
MFKFVQGRVDASHKWGEHVEEVIFLDLGLIPNHADLANSRMTHLMHEAQTPMQQPIIRGLA